MNQNNRQDFSLKKKKGLKAKINSNYKPGQWLRWSHWNRFGNLTLTAFMFTVMIMLLSPAWLPIGHSVTDSALAKETNQRLILAQEETEERREEAAEPEESVREEAAEPEESAEEEAAEPEESAGEEAAEPEESAEEEAAEPEESAEEEAAEPEAEFSFEEAKKSLEEEINEKYEEWESEKTKSEISHSISAIATIIMTIFITLLGLGVLDIPYKRWIIFILGIITVFVQLNINVFLLEKSLAGYEILADQGLTLKTKLESVRTEEQLEEVREQFQELVLESLTIE
ncbi:MAG: hypothetical protein QNJ65_07020 [Xenococcaceae cyanobacterium MO_234.B1]|nr:hypothetical protein [Xenococcaceae cyanobacterium MO_234.B1]